VSTLAGTEVGRGRDRTAADALTGLFLLLPALWVLGHAWPPVNHDVAANLDMAGRWLDGERLYRDIIDVNTPFVFLFYAVPEGLARLFGGAGTVWMVAVVAALAGLSSALSARTIAAWGDGTTITARLLVPLVPFVLCILPPDNSFGQREHVMTVLAFPYLLTAAGRAEGRRPGRWLTVSLTLAAGFGFSMKPHFLVVPALVELYVLVARRFARSAFADPAPWTIGAVVASHAAFAAFVVSDYVTFVLPLTFAAYTRIGGSDALTVLTGRYIMPALVGLVVVSALTLALPRPHPARVFVLFGLAGALSAVAQGKGWAYQSYPVMAAAVMATGVALAALLDRALPRTDRLTPAMVATGLLTLFLVQDAMLDPPFEKQRAYPGSALAQMTRLVEENAPNRRVLVLSPGIFPIYPMINDAGVRMSMPFQTMWPIQGFYADCPDDAVLYVEPDEMSKHERLVFDMVAEAFAREQPDLLVLDRVPGIPRCRSEIFSYVEYFRRHPLFARTFRGYEVMAEKDRYVVWRRRVLEPDEGEPDTAP
jgi:hypothetical protein